jgi:alpha-galactosidase
MNSITHLFLLVVAVFLISCKGQDEKIQVKKHEIIIQSGELAYRLKSDLGTQLSFKGKLTAPETRNQPNSFLLCQNDTVLFSLDMATAKVSSVTNLFGHGQQIEITGYANDTSLKIEEHLELAIYEKYPNTIISSISYFNAGKSSLEIAGAVCNRITLDASSLEPGKKPYEFSIFSGASHKWGKDDIVSISPSYSSLNYMGLDTSTNFAGGIPIIDIWNKSMGLAIAQIEPFPVLVSFPVKVGQDSAVQPSMEDHKNTVLLPGEIYKMPRTAIIAHDLDYFNPLKTYATLLSDQGIKKKTASAESYEPIWCSWGYGFNFTKKNVLNSLPKLKELGIHWVVIDDRWFDHYGDWKPRKEIFPGGEKDLKNFVSTLHAEGFKVQIWWYPSAVQGNTCPPKEKYWIRWDCKPSELAKKYPNWFILNQNGDYFVEPRFLWSLCPALPEVKKYIGKITERLLKDYDFDGIKIDALYEVPPCYNPAHHHENPEDSYQQYPEIIKVIHDKAKAIKPESVILICNCGSVQDFFQIVNTDQPETSDPASSFQNRSRTKYLKALCGSDCPVFGDFTEMVKYDYSSTIGVGAVPATEFNFEDTKVNNNFLLTTEKEMNWKKWNGLFHAKMLPKGKYLNLYDIIYDKPETHVIQKGDTLYYACYAKEFEGKLELRGLISKNYKVTDYVNNVPLGVVEKGTPYLKVKFKNYLLFECIAEK